MKLTFAGASDDLIEITGPDGPDEFNVYGKGPIMWSADVADPDGMPVILVMVLLLNDNGCWHVAAGQVDEDTPMPDWPISVRQDPTCSYASELAIDAPDGCTLAIHKAGRPVTCRDIDNAVRSWRQTHPQGART